MELTPGQRRLVFVVIVLVLVGLCAYLVSAHRSNGTPAAAPSTSAPAPSVSASGASSASGVPPSVLPAPTPASTVGGAEIYQWLPFTAADLATAAQNTVTFAKAYATWSYTESAAAYGATMKNLVIPTQLTSIESGYETSGVAGPRTADKQVSTGSGTIDSISSFVAHSTQSQTSITFLVTIDEKVTSTQPTATSNSQYAVTMVSSGGTWQVYSLNLASLGNS
jgi:hypothetical protein